MDVRLDGRPGVLPMGTNQPRETDEVHSAGSSNSAAARSRTPAHCESVGCSADRPSTANRSVSTLSDCGVARGAASVRNRKIGLSCHRQQRGCLAHVTQLEPPASRRPQRGRHLTDHRARASPGSGRPVRRSRASSPPRWPGRVRTSGREPDRARHVIEGRFVDAPWQAGGRRVERRPVLRLRSTEAAGRRDLRTTASTPGVGETVEARPAHAHGESALSSPCAAASSNSNRSTSVDPVPDVVDQQLRRPPASTSCAMTLTHPCEDANSKPAGGRAGTRRPGPRRRPARPTTHHPAPRRRIAWRGSSTPYAMVSTGSMAGRPAARGSEPVETPRRGRTCDAVPEHLELQQCIGGLRVASSAVPARLAAGAVPRDPSKCGFHPAPILTVRVTGDHPRCCTCSPRKVATRVLARRGRVVLARSSPSSPRSCARRGRCLPDARRARRRPRARRR